MAAAAADELSPADDEDDVGADMAPVSASGALATPAPLTAPGGGGAWRDVFLCPVAETGGDCLGLVDEVGAESAGDTPLRGEDGVMASVTATRVIGPPLCCWRDAAALAGPPVPPLSGDCADRVPSGDSELAVELGAVQTLG